MTQTQESLIEVKEKPRMVEWAFLVGLCHGHEEVEHVEELLDELAELTDTLGVNVVGRTVARLRRPQSRYLLGEGKADEIAAMAKEAGADVIVLDDELTPSQQRNWEARADLAVIDRQEVILDIFAKHATTREAELQVALARSKYDLPRLKRRWTHLHRQRGMTGGQGMRGEGEQQLEVDARLVRKRITSLEQQLEEVRRHRRTQSKRRNRQAIPQGAIVGYTNAGKSTLLNALTGADVYVQNKLFATLDSTVRRVDLNRRSLLLSDTVGFIRKLPHQLVEAFHSTLETAAEAHFLVEVLDATSEALDGHHDTTRDVLKELGAWGKSVIPVFNKVDALTDRFAKRRLLRRYPDAVFVSAKTGEGLDELRARLEEEVRREGDEVECLVPHHRYDLIAYLHREADVLSQEHEAEGVRMTVAGAPDILRTVADYTQAKRANAGPALP